MRNLKKFLALVLAMVMAMSLMITANAANVEFDDSKDIDPRFEEAALVLSGLGVFKGNDEGNFNPKGEITRAEVAAIIYRLATSDVTDKQVHIYDDYGKFKDVSPTAWYAGYVGYCANAEYIKGHDGYFYPMTKVTGYEALAMILRTVGYDQNGEFSGSGWQVRVASLAKELGVTANVLNENFDNTLNKAATREVVADLLFQTAATVPTVTYTPALAYNDKQDLTGKTFNPTLGQKNFGLWYQTGWVNSDAWGRPGYNWYKNGAWDGTTVTNANNGKAYVMKDNHPLYTGATIPSNHVALITADPDYDTHEQVHECDVAAALDIDTVETFNLYVNGTNGSERAGAVTTDYQIVATDTVTPVGGQGRITEFYYNTSSKWFTGSVRDAVMIDTMLARVDNKTDAKLDANNHVIVPAKLEVTIWDGTQLNGASGRDISKPATSTENWDEYSKGDMILVHAWTNKSGRTTQPAKEAAAFQPDKVINAANGLVINSRAWIEQKAESFQGKQTTVFYNQNKHQVDSKDYNDQLCLFLDQAGTTTNTTFTWYLDQFGNLIGIGNAHAVNYGVITSIYAAFGTGDPNTDTTGAVKAVANVRYADGTTGTVTIDKFLMSWGKELVLATGSSGAEATRQVAGATVGLRTEPGTTLGNGGTVTGIVTPTTPDVNAAAAGTALAGDLNKDTIELRPVYDTVSHPALSVGPIETNYTFTGVAQAAWLYLAPSTSTNNNAHFATGTNCSDAFRILYDNLFEFSVADDNSVIATEVAGSWNTRTAVSSVWSGNTNANFGNMANAISSDDTGVLYKSLSYMTFKTAALTTAAGTAVGQQLVYVDNDTQIMVRLGNTTINCYKGVNDLPGNVNIGDKAEIDWADTDNDGRADYVYISAGTIPSTVTYGLFYYNGTGAQWNGSDSTGTINGFLNGKSETVTFADRDAFTTVQTSVSGYDGHLFAVRMENGQVTDLLNKVYMNAVISTYGVTPFILQDSDSANADYALANRSGFGIVDPTAPGQNFSTLLGIPTAAGVGGTATTIITAAPAATDAIETPVFGLGSDHGNSYTTNTRAVYWYSKVNPAAVAGETVLRYVRESNGHRIEATVVGSGVTTLYWLAPNCEINGELALLNQRNCDVTMVYEEGAARSVTQIFITPDPDITPSDYNTVASLGGTGTTAINLPIGTTPAILKAQLFSGQRDTVIFSPYTTNPNDASLGNLKSSCDADELLYFPYSAPNGSVITLSIYNATTGALVYREGAYTVATGGLAAGSDAHAFVLDITNATNVAGSYAPGMPLLSGVGYRFEITDASNTVWSDGAFMLAV